MQVEQGMWDARLNGDVSWDVGIGLRDELGWDAGLVWNPYTHRYNTDDESMIIYIINQFTLNTK